MKVVRTIIYICLVVAVLFTGYQLEMRLNKYRVAQDIHIERALEVRSGRDVDFAKLKEQSDDVVGWIYLPDSKINYPVVQGEDNDFYLHRGLDGNYLDGGSIFVDAGNEEPFKDFNTVIYGHRMMSGAMFADLKHYADQEYMDSHRIIQIETPEKSYDLHVVAFCNEDYDSGLYSTDFHDWQISFEDDDISYSTDEDETSSGPSSKADFVDLVNEKAKVLSGEGFGTDDTFVTLSTCVTATSDSRIQVIGILKSAAMEEHITETKTEKPFINKWLVLQILVGTVMALIIIVPLIPRKR